MNQNRPEHHYDDGARLAQRYNGAGRARRVTFGPFALLVGTCVTHFLIAAGVGLAAIWSSPDAVFIYFLIAALYGIPLTAIAFPLALILGLLLRPVANQVLHIAAFFAVFAILSGAVIHLASGGDPAALALAPMIGTAAAAGRASVWKLVTVHPAVGETEHLQAE